MDRTRNGRIVRERDRSRPRELARVLLGFVLLSSPVFFYVWEQVQLYQMGQEIQTMERHAARLAEEGRKLDLERARLVALGRVERIARESLGFVDGLPVEVLALGSPHPPREAREVVARAEAPAPGGARSAEN
jgi:cell division protein FtsL